MKILTTLVLSIFLTLTVGCTATGQARAADGDYFSQAELDSMLAPVALYPDSVLSHVLIAATYPLEVIQAARWSREHPGLRGEDAVAAVEHYEWDPSVKALVAFPELLRRMDEDLQWTQDLGDAFLVQEEDVIASIQYLRSEAYSQGHLRSNEHVRIVREKEYIYIEPARTRVVYVPYYDPRVIYTGWRWHSYPPHYWHRPSGFNVSLNFYWGRPYHIRPSFYFSSFHWPTRRVVVVNHHHHYHEHYHFRSGRDVAHFKEARHWKHDPAHRRGVSYRGRVETTRFVNNSRPASASVTTRDSSARSAVRSDRRDWAAERRSSIQFDRGRAESGSRTSSRSDRVAELRGSNRSDSRTSARAGSIGGREARVAERGSDRASTTRDRGRTISGSAPARAESRSRSSDDARSSSGRASRVSESLRGSSSSRSSATSSRAASTRSSIRSSRSRDYDHDRSSGLSGSRSSSSSASGRSPRASGQRSSVSIPRDLSVRSGTSREHHSAPSRSSRSSAPSRSAGIDRGSAPSRQSAPSRSSYGGREAAPSRSTPRVKSPAPSRSSSSAPQRSRGASSRSSRGSAPSRSRSSESRRGGGDR